MNPIMQLETVLSAKGQIVIPKAIREANHWAPGMRMVIESTPQGMWLKPIESKKTLTAMQVAGCAAYQGPAKTIGDMNDAIRLGVKAKMGNKKVWI
jgi:AbrB family looped-hinge helix DNA binding protein